MPAITGLKLFHYVRKTAQDFCRTFHSLWARDKSNCHSHDFCASAPELSESNWQESRIEGILNPHTHTQTHPISCPVSVNHTPAVQRSSLSNATHMDRMSFLSDPSLTHLITLITQPRHQHASYTVEVNPQYFSQTTWRCLVLFQMVFLCGPYQSRPQGSCWRTEVWLLFAQPSPPRPSAKGPCPTVLRWVFLFLLRLSFRVPSVTWCRCRAAQVFTSNRIIVC